MKSSVLGVALAVSILINVALLGRRAPEPAAPPPTAAKPAAAPAADVAAELERERALTRELRESVRRLEEEKAVLAQAATAPGAPAAAVAAKPSLREKLRRIKKVVKAAEEGGQPDQEAMLEMSGEIMEIFRLGLTRGKDPQTYADFIQACAEIGLEDEAPRRQMQRLHEVEDVVGSAGGEEPLAPEELRDGEIRRAHLTRAAAPRRRAPSAARLRAACSARRGSA